MKENSLIKNKLKIRVGHHFCWTLVQVMNPHCVSYFCSIDSATGTALYPIRLLLFSWMFIACFKHAKPSNVSGVNAKFSSFFIDNLEHDCM